MRREWWLAVAAGFGGLALLQSRIGRWGMDVPGRRKSFGTRMLELGARVLQRRAPLRGFDVHLVGLHPMRDDPGLQMDAHHYCKVVNEDFMQCVLFDGDGADARLTGVEFIISERLFRSLPEAEQALWHPHNYEILSGTLIAPSLPRFVEKLLMRTKVNSYGKTWHVWRTGEGERLPLGEPHLAWSFNRDGEVAPGLLAERERRYGDTQRRREQRADLAARAMPQRGVDLLDDALGSDAERPPGVVEAGRADEELSRG